MIARPPWGTSVYKPAKAAKESFLDEIKGEIEKIVDDLRDKVKI